MRKTCCSTIAAALLCAFPVGTAMSQEHGGHGSADGKQTAEQKPADSHRKLPLCPVMGETVDFTVKTMTDDGPVYFCCDPCIKKFEKEPAKYTEKLTAQREALRKMERIQVTCPVSGNPIDGKTTILARDKKVVDFCCKRCVSKFENVDNTEADNKRLNAKLEACYTYQTRCPVSGDKINPTAFTDLPTGQRIYLCCSGCSEKLLKDPAKYAPKLAEQGINVDLKKLQGEKPKKDEHDGHKQDHP